jgi:hypothetical protein
MCAKNILFKANLLLSINRRSNDSNSIFHQNISGCAGREFGGLILKAVLLNVISIYVCRPNNRVYFIVLLLTCYKEATGLIKFCRASCVLEV